MKKRLLTGLIMAVMAFILTACGNNGDPTGTTGSAADTGSAKDDVEVADIVDAIKKEFGDTYIPNEQLEPELIEERMGILTEWYEEIIAETALINTRVDTVVVVKANKEDVQKVHDALTKYRDDLMKDTTQYPQNQSMIQASRVDQTGNYVSFLLVGEIPNDVLEAGEEEVIKTAQAENARAYEIMKNILTNSK